MLVLKGLVGLHRTVQLQLIHDIEWFALEMNRDHSVIFETASKYCISDSFVDSDGYSISSNGEMVQERGSCTSTGAQLRGAPPHPRSEAAVRRSYPTSRLGQQPRGDTRHPR